MGGAHRIPKALHNFNSFLLTSTAYLNKEENSVKNAIRLGLNQAELDKWLDYKNNWEQVFPLYTNKVHRTTTVTKNKNTLANNFKKFAQPLLRRMSFARLINSNDRDVLKMPERYKHYKKRGKINEEVWLSLARSHGGRMHLRCRIPASEGRARLHPLADAIEIVYKIGEVPRNPDDCPDRVLISKALSSLELGVENMGRKMYAFARYVNLSRKENNGPWCTMQQEWI